MIWSPPSISSRACNMALREIKSKAPTPSMDTTVNSTSMPVSIWTMCAMHSHPTRADNASWQSQPFCCTAAPQSSTPKRRKMSPTVMSRTPPSGLLNAVMRPILKISPGTFPHAKRDANSENFIESRSLSSNGNKQSAFIPDGPGVAPRRDVRKL